MKPLHPAALPHPISPLALGTWALAGDKFWGAQAEQDSIATIHAALDAGVTLIDTAPAYGDGLSEEIVGRALRGRRDRAVLATKISEADLTPERTVASCETSLRRLQTDCIDLLQIHWLGSGERLEEVIAAMEGLRAAGKVRTLGVCNFGAHSLGRLRAASRGWITNQLPYNLIWRAIEFEIVGACQRDGLGILCYSPLQQGLLTAVSVRRTRSRWGAIARVTSAPTGRCRATAAPAAKPSPLPRSTASGPWRPALVSRWPTLRSPGSCIARVSPR